MSFFLQHAIRALVEECIYYILRADIAAAIEQGSSGISDVGY